MPPNPHIPIIPTLPPPCDRGPAKGQGLGWGAWDTWGGGVGIMERWEGRCELLCKLLCKLRKVGVGAFLSAPRSAVKCHGTIIHLHRDRQAWSVHRACLHRCALVESSFASTNGFKCVALSTEDEENIRCSRTIVHNRHSEVVLQNRPSFFLWQCCKTCLVAAVLQHRLCCKTSCVTKPHVLRISCPQPGQRGPGNSNNIMGAALTVIGRLQVRR